ncbi:MAG: hypothetical protein P9X24_03970 [Candidatus Hatepunaea meridiana]|nr:hypothetical protein [Candidatus Hatepunaea meridiana]
MVIKYKSHLKTLIIDKLLPGVVYSICFLLLHFSDVSAENNGPWFYKGYNYGSQANYNPLALHVNSSFDILQITNRNNDPFSISYDRALHNVTWNLSHAGSVIKQYGWRRFIETEVFPTTISLKNAQYWPNYKLHLIGGGMTYIAITEWFKYHRYKYPRVLSWITMGSYHFLNEIVENNRYVGPNVDPIADIMIFDPLGIALFSIRGVPQFFANRLNMADWSFQPLYDFRTRTLVNNGQKFSFKVKLPYLNRWSFFYLTGTEGLAGLTYKYKDSDNITVGYGLSARELKEIDNNTGVRTLTTRLIQTGGIFYDRNNSLLASLIFGGPRGYIARMNIYPNSLKVNFNSPGFVIAYQDDNTITLGIIFHFVIISPGFSMK